MKEYFYGEKPICLGKSFHLVKDINDIHYEYHCDKLTEEYASILVNKGILTYKENTTVENITIKDCFQYYANKNNWSYIKAVSFINKVTDCCWKAGFDMLLKAAAVLMDKNHEGHIMNEPVVWVVSANTMKPMKIAKNAIFSYLNIAAFRSEAEANKALQMLSDGVKFARNYGRE